MYEQKPFRNISKQRIGKKAQKKKEEQKHGQGTKERRKKTKERGKEDRNTWKEEIKEDRRGV